MKVDLLSARVDELENVWVKMVGSKALYVSSLYRPHEKNDELSQLHLKTSLDRIAEHNNSHIWLAGDRNFPGIDWKTKSIKPGCRATSLHQDFGNGTNKR